MSESFPVVAPYAADTDTENGGSVQLSGFSDNSPDSSAMKNVNDFIQSQTRDYFVGTQMMVAEWRDVPLKNQNVVSLCYLHKSCVLDILTTYLLTLSTFHRALLTPSKAS